MRVINRYQATKEDDNRSLWMLQNATFRTIHFALIADDVVSVRKEQAKHDKTVRSYVDDPKPLVNPEMAKQFLLANGYEIPRELRRKLGE